MLSVDVPFHVLVNFVKTEKSAPDRVLSWERDNRISRFMASLSWWVAVERRNRVSLIVCWLSPNRFHIIQWRSLSFAISFALLILSCLGVICIKHLFVQCSTLCVLVVSPDKKKTYKKLSFQLFIHKKKRRQVYGGETAGLWMIRRESFWDGFNLARRGLKSFQGIVYGVVWDVWWEYRPLWCRE